MKRLNRHLRDWRRPGFRSRGPVAGARAARGARSETLLDAAIESTPNGLCIFDADLRVVISNRHFAEMYGLAPEQTRPGTPLRDILDNRAAASRCPPDADQYIADCLGKARTAQTLHTLDELGLSLIHISEPTRL